WERFRDPRETTYARYTALQSRKEIFVDGVLESMQSQAHNAGLTPAWLETLELALAPSLFPIHGLQMVASYIGQMAPSGRITIAALFQAADEMRRAERIAYRVRQLHLRSGLAGELPERSDSLDGVRSRWMTDPAWQPLRETVERLLVTYDWGEAFTALNL